jgi:chondroitin 4-sulfotransferase 11
MKRSDYFLSNTKMLPSDVIVLLLITLSLSTSDSKTFEYRLTQANNIQRQELLQRKCDKYDLGDNELYQNETIHTLSEADLEHLLIDKKHKFLYCYVPKVS